MALLLRVDVDKPYGRSNLVNKVKSKLAEDYWFPRVNNYLNHLKEFIEYCNSECIQGYFYFRTCTAPNVIINKLLIEGKHKIGFHAEDTRNIESFKSEVNNFKAISAIDIDSFTKHGSGTLKLGKHHYPPYEPEKYLEWSKILKFNFFLGNGIAKNREDVFPKNGIYPNMFWMEREYRNENFYELGQAIDYAKINIMPILIHPCNFAASEIVKNDFKSLVRMSKENSIKWILFQ
jgi:hypothetical protein